MKNKYKKLLGHLTHYNFVESSVCMYCMNFYQGNGNKPFEEILKSMYEDGWRDKEGILICPDCYQEHEKHRDRFEYNNEHTWEYNLFQFVRWESPEKIKGDVVFFVKTYFDKISSDLGNTDLNWELNDD